jgi:hypothetical protein
VPDYVVNTLPNGRVSALIITNVNIGVSKVSTANSNVNFDAAKIRNAKLKINSGVTKIGIGRFMTGTRAASLHGCESVRINSN